jgi:hypothetical protein
MTDKTTHELIDEAARRIANDIIAGDLNPNERMKAFQALIDYRKVVTVDAEPEPPSERFDQMRDRIRAAGLVGAVDFHQRTNGNEPAE